MSSAVSRDGPNTRHSVRIQMALFVALAASFGLVSAIPLGSDPVLTFLGGLAIRTACVLVLVQIAAWMGRMQIGTWIGIASVLIADAAWIIVLYCANNLTTYSWATNGLVGWALICTAPQLSRRLWVNVAGLFVGASPMVIFGAIIVAGYYGAWSAPGLLSFAILAMNVVAMVVSVGAITTARILLYEKRLN